MAAKLTIICEEAGERLDTYLVGKAGGLSRSGIQKLIADGGIRVNGEIVQKNHRARAGDAVSVEMPEDEPQRVAGQDIKLDVIYEDAHIIVVDKPRGMVVHPGSGNREGTLANALVHHCAGALSDAGGLARPGVVHRLDKDTSGLIVAAKTNEAHAKLAAEFKERRVRKIYNAIVHGHVGHDRGRIDMPIGRHETDRKRMAVRGDGGRGAVTLFRVVMRLPCAYTWLELEILTGRTHQIRVHLERIGHPVAGDPVYSRAKSRAGCPGCPGRGLCTLEFQAQAGCAPIPAAAGPACPLEAPACGQLLHSSLLEFAHPLTGERLTFRSPLPGFFPSLICDGSVGTAAPGRPQ